jgi:tellurite resistance-related uncharacterized protein
MHDERLPGGLELARTTAVFSNDTVPAGLLAAHKVATGVWGRLVVQSGSVGLRFEDASDELRLASVGESIVIPPERPHHVELDGPTEFVVEFYRPKC